MYKKTAALIGLLLIGAPLAGCVVVEHDRRHPGYYDQRRDYDRGYYDHGYYDGRRGDYRRHW